MGNTRNTGYLQNIVQYDASNNITLPARLAVTGTVAVNNTTPYDTTQFSLDVNGGLIVKNTGKTAQIALINANPAAGGNAGFVIHTVGGTSGSSYADIQGYYGTSIAGSTVIRLNPLGGNVLIGSLAGTGTRIVVADSTGVLSTQATQTIADLNGVPTSRTLTINGTSYDLSSNRSWTINSMVYPGAGIAVSTGTAWGTSITDNSSNWNTAYGWGNHASAGYATTTYVGTQIANLVASAPATLDTLNELAAALGNDPSFATTISTALGNRLRIDTGTQSLTSTQQGYGRTNLGLGSLATLSSIDNSYITDLAWSKITGVPSFLTSYTETSTLANVTARGASTSTAVTFSGGATISNLLINGAPSIAESSLALGAMGVDEGGQLTLNKATSWTYAAHIDIWHDNLRFLYGTNTATSGVVMALNLSTKQLILSQYTTSTSFTGTAAGVLAFDSSGNIITIAVPGGAVSSVNAGTGVSVNQNTGAITVSIGQSVATSASPTFDQVIATNNGNGTNFKIGDDAWIGDINAANTFRVQGVQDATQGYIVFGNSNATALGRSGTGALTYGGNTIYHAGNLTNLNQLTNGPGYITGYTETDPYRVTAVAVSGTSTKTITITRADSSTVTTTWTDIDTDTNTYASSLGFSGGTLTLTNNNASTVTVSLDGRYYLATNPSGYITGITSANVTTALGYTPYNSSNPSGYISSYTETDTLASVTARGSSTTGSITVNGNMDAQGIVYARANQTTAYTSAALWTQSFGSSLTGIAFHVSGVVGRMLHMNASTTDANLYWNGTALVYNSGTWGINVTGTANNITAYTINQNLGTGNTPTFYQSRFTSRISVGDGNGTPFLNTGSPGVWLSYNGGSDIFMGSSDSVTAGFYIGGWKLTVNSSGNVVATGTISASNFSGSSSGTNTGDQTNISGNAGSVTNGVYTTGDQTIGGVKTFGKRTYFGSSSNWDSGSLSGENDTITNVHFQGHADFWIGAGNGTWYTTATAGDHDLIINTMQAQSSYNRGISFTASFSGTSGYKLGKWYSGTSAATSYLSVSGGLVVGGTTTLTSIKGAAQTVPNTYGAYLHLGDWGVARTAAGAVLVNTAYRADYATDLFDMNISRFTNNAGYITSSGSVVTIQDTAPSGVVGRLWWESDTGKLKVYYGSAWVDAMPIPDSSLFFSKAGGSITGDVSIGQTLNVVGNTLVQGTIYSFGDVIAYSSSDIRLKDNITTIDAPLEKLSKINGVSFNWNDKQSIYEVGTKDYGVIAQEIEAVLPELVTTRDNGYKAVRYEKIVSLLIEAVKEQQIQINKLTDKLNNL